MDEPFTRIQDLTAYKVHYRPHGRRVALWDCPKVIRDAAGGRPPEAYMRPWRDMMAIAWPFLLLMGMFAGVTIGFVALGAIPPQATALQAWKNWIPWGSGIAVTLLYSLMFWWQHPKDEQAIYAREKALFDSYAANPELFRDEIYKAAVQRLPLLDLNGKHRSPREAKVGRLEAEVIEGFRRLGVLQETTVANRGKPFLVHQFELVGLKWGRWENGDSKNYVLDLAILWPERRIKFNIEVDDPSHNEAARTYKDARRDEVLTERGWFVRRFNHKFLNDNLASGELPKHLKEVVGIVYFFAKYANNTPLDGEERIGIWLQERRYRRKEQLARQAQAKAARQATAPSAPSTGEAQAEG